MKKMKKMKKIVLLSVFVLGVFAACASQPAKESKNAKTAEEKTVNTDFSSIMGKKWDLMEVKSDSTETVIDRSGNANIYTLTFSSDGTASGKGAPNNYRSPYTLTENKGIAFSLIAGTLMAPIFEPEGLKEHDYYQYLEKTTRWDVSNGQLQLFTKDDSGEVILIFSEASEKTAPQDESVNSGEAVKIAP
jgi:heat shock protein HslJ